MASPAVAHQSLPRPSKRRPFATWVRRLARRSSDPSSSKGEHGLRLRRRDGERQKNNPYPESGHLQGPPPAAASVFSGDSRTGSTSIASGSISERGNGGGALSTRSKAPTVETYQDTIHSDAGNSRTFTAKTGGGLSSMDGMAVNSTFSSPNHSEHSLTTTLTTIHSTSPNLALGNHNTAAGNNASISFSQPFPVMTPVSAIPSYLAPSGQPSTYSAATANNLLTDDASIMTLASSSKRRRRRSMDTDASVRALAPSSVFGGSRESLPLSVISSHTAAEAGQSQGHPPPPTSRPSIGGASVYSGHSVAAPALVSDRNSFYATSVRQSVRDKDARSIDGRSMHRLDAEDGKSVYGAKSLHDGKGYEGSVKSGKYGHVRNDSNAGSGRPLESISRQSSWHRVERVESEADMS